MSENLGAGGQPGPTAPIEASNTGEDQGSRYTQGIVNLTHSFKETLIVNRRRRNVNFQGSYGVNGGTSKTEEVMRSRFMTLITESPEVVEVGTDSQPLGEENGACVLPRVVQMDGIGRNSSVLINADKVVVQQQK
ncbi:hypothetical protein V6N13_029584 [Hibiscus sabdariffa]|uniref:Uncharacterized protein n=1 Tax=Hibiscus sabdariffa TaxID=183260 RepID=A0ABR2T9J1_9ROSI